MVEKFDADWKRSLEERARQIEENRILLPGFPETEENQPEIQNARKFEPIKPGFIVEVEDISKRDNNMMTIEIVGEPYEDTEHYWYADVTLDNGKDDPLHMIINLADYGIVPYPNGTLDNIRRPVKWYTREGGKKQ
jgi:hypothetical protein